MNKSNFRALLGAIAMLAFLSPLAHAAAGDAYAEELVGYINDRVATAMNIYRNNLTPPSPDWNQLIQGQWSPNVGAGDLSSTGGDGFEGGSSGGDDDDDFGFDFGL